MNLVIGVAGFVICIIGLIQAIISRFMEKKTRHFFIAFFSLLTIYVLFNLLGQITDGHYGIAWARFARFTLFSESFFSILSTVLMTMFLLYQCKEFDFAPLKGIRNPLLLISVGLLAVYVVMLITTQITGTFYYIDDNNIYKRGPFYPLLLVPPVAIMVLNLAALFIKRKRLSFRQRLAFTLFAIVPMVSMLIQMAIYGVYFIVLGTAIASFCMLMFILVEQTESYVDKERENAQLKIDILLAQIQPHFLYNSLSTIQYLCKKDSATAEEAIGEFTTYLRYNMDSLTKDYPIPFNEALNHVKEYLYLQKLRFGDELKVHYDMECTDFRIPSLTLQPLVENAVSYGIRKSESGEGNVTITTRDYPDRVEVSVIDDGPGFDYEKVKSDGSRSHIGISNVRERLKRISGGTLKIYSCIGQGTTVTIILPKD